MPGFINCFIKSGKLRLAVFFKEFPRVPFERAEGAQGVFQVPACRKRRVFSLKYLYETFIRREPLCVFTGFPAA